MSYIKKKWPVVFIPPFYYVLYFFYNKINLIDGDAASLIKLPKTLSPVAFAVGRYGNWSSRLWIEAATMFSVDHLVLFSVVTVISIVIILWCLSDVFGFRSLEDNVILSLFTILLLPISLFDSAGWVATIVNYLWPIALFTIWLWVDHKVDRKSSSIVGLVVGAVSLMLAVFNEELALLTFLILMAKLVLAYKKNIANWAWFGFSFVISLAGVVNVLTCPGNHLRKTKEIAEWFPQFNQVSILDKAMIQANHIFIDVIRHDGPILEVLILVLMIMALLREKRVTAYLLIFAEVITLIAGPKLATKVNELFVVTKSGHVTAKMMDSLYLPTVLMVIVGVIVVASLFRLFKKEVAIPLGGTLISTLIVGMTMIESPTMLGSADRPYLLFIGACIICSAAISKKIFDYGRRKRRNNIG